MDGWGLDTWGLTRGYHSLEVIGELCVNEEGRSIHIRGRWRRPRLAPGVTETVALLVCDVASVLSESPLLAFRSQFSVAVAIRQPSHVHSFFLIPPRLFYF